MVPRASSGTTPLFKADGTSLLTDKEAVLKRWAEHFDSVLNRPSSINNDAFNRLLQVECSLLLDEFPTVAETVKAIKLLSSGKAPGLDAIPAEIYKAGGTPVAKKMTELFHLVKRKEDPQLSDYHRGISLLSIAGRVLARVLLNRLHEHFEQSGLLPENQCGFRKDRRTVDMIFTARQLQETCQAQNMDLYMTFGDLTKAFDIVSREGLWKIMAKFGCPTKFIAVMRQFHDGMLARVLMMMSFLIHSL